MNKISRWHQAGSLGVVVALALTACTGGSGGAGTDSGPGVAGGRGPDGVIDGSGETDALVANGIAPFDFGSARDQVFLNALVDEQGEAARAACVVRLGGVSTYVPRVLERTATADIERIGDFPDLDVMAEAGFMVEVPEVPAEISREDYATDTEYFEAQLEAMADRVYSDDERDLWEDCEGSPEMAAVAESQDLYRSLTDAWAGVIRDIDATPEVHARRTAFVDCVVAAGMPADPKLNEISFAGQAQGEVIDAPHEVMSAHMRERGQLFAECASDLYGLKERLRREAHDEFVEEHEADIARLSNLLYGDGLLDTDG